MPTDDNSADPRHAYPHAHPHREGAPPSSGGHADDEDSQACAVAHGTIPAAIEGRRLVAVFASPVAAELAHIAAHVGYQVVVLEPQTGRDCGGAARVGDVDSAALDDLTDVVVTDHDRPELGEVLAGVLDRSPRWVGVMGSPRHVGPHVAALDALGVPPEVIARVHRPIGLDIGSRSPAEIAVSTVAGLLADRAGRSGGSYPDTPAT